MAIASLRRDYRHIESWRNIRAVTMVWLWTVVLAIVGTRFGWIGAVAAFVLMGPMHARFAILMHEAAHRLLFARKRVNDEVGTWLLAYPAIRIPIRHTYKLIHTDYIGHEIPRS